MDRSVFLDGRLANAVGRDQLARICFDTIGTGAWIVGSSKGGANNSLFVGGRGGCGCNRPQENDPRDAGCNVVECRMPGAGYSRWIKSRLADLSSDGDCVRCNCI